MKDRVKDFRRIPAKELKVNPKNWRTHPPQQKKVLKGLLKEVGFAGALLARELPDGSLELIDGHLRKETAPNETVPVLVLDVNEQEAGKLLATFDPLAAMAGTNETLLNELLQNIETENEALAAFLNEKNLNEKKKKDNEKPDAYEVGNKIGGVKLNEIYQLVITCEDEAEQQEIYEGLVLKGLDVRVVNL